jgi:GWxTD domain-containing protein
MQAAEPELTLVRSYRAGTGQTLVDVFVRVPLSVATPLTPGTSGNAAYRVGFTVRDTANLTLVSQTWSQLIPARLLTLGNSSTVEHAVFAAKPGRYSVEVTFTDSATGRVTRTSGMVSGFATSPGASDLLLASGMRRIGATDSTPQSGEVRKGGVMLLASGAEVLTPRQASLGYYLEVYTARAETLSTTARVLRDDGSQVIAAPAKQVPLQSGGGVLEEMLDLSGLPPGKYRLEVALAGPDSNVTRAATFRMAGFETENAAAALAVTEQRSAFDTMPEAQLDSAYAPLIYLMSAAEMGMYSTLTLEGKRNFMRQFWARRDPTPGTPANEQMQQFYSRIDEANRRFREGGSSSIPGWRTDRGRIFIRYGLPDEKLQRPESGPTAPYEVWKYTRGRALKFVFMDLTRFGNYALIYTNDRRESIRPDWESLLGTEAVTDVERF